MVDIIIKQPGSPPSSAVLQSGAYLIGSDPSCQICVPRPEISGRHAQLVVNANNILLTDLGSRNGTYVDGKHITPHHAVVMPFTAQVQIGKISLSFQAKNAAVSENNSNNSASAAANSAAAAGNEPPREDFRDRKSTRLNSSHSV